MILDDKFGIKPYQIQLRRARIKVKEFIEKSHNESFKSVCVCVYSIIEAI